ncbi:multidrug ABC transporter ATP-binding protein [Arthrobacter sp. SW1]|uniref:ABC transporter ATP-binding protein n=1 Tax=Arthrobacter sp. SW1 TaxID=1920889 RepID=UPI000877CD7F|nr:ABC transporter ATP-binding protein [Arthrobacter sp. SW1]OFI38080.1 multidrug ABC transporter ATP-binding protein [Arthrobacter sp. SW1]
MLAALVLRRLSPYRWHVLAIVVLQLIQVGATLLLPTLNAGIVDDGLVAGNSAVVLELGGRMLALAFVQVLAAVSATYLGAVVAMRIGRRLRQELFEKIHALPAQEAERFGPASLVVRTTNDVLQVQTTVVLVFGMLVAAPVMGVGGVVLAVEQDGTLAWLVFAIIPVLMVIMLRIVRRLVPLYRQGQGLVDRINTVIREQILGVMVIRAFVRRSFERRRFAAANGALTANNLRSARIVAAMLPLVMIVVNLSSVAVVWLGGLRIVDGRMELGALTAFTAYIMQILLAIMMVMYVLSAAPRAEVSAERIAEVLNAQDDRREPPVPEPAQVPAGNRHGRHSAAEAQTGPGPALRFDDVSFAFPGAEACVLEGISFEARPGTTTAIIGSTGSGKSTLLRLVPRLLEPSGGRITLGGQDTAAMPLEVLRRSIAAVPQRTWLFDGTVAENLRISLPTADDARLWDALEAAQAASFVAALPDGIDTVLAQGGGLSGGQKQRLCIARALLRPASAYLFDDSFSALDALTESRIFAALGERLASAAVLMVAQRVRSIESADRILVVDNGRIVGSGTHAELLAGSRHYQEIVSSQLDSAGTP